MSGVQIPSVTRFDTNLPIASGGRFGGQAPLAQLAEHRTLNPQVPGSSPGGRTTNIAGISTSLRCRGFRRVAPETTRGHTVVT